jgi:CheY-like chemotaxis protein
MLHQVLGEDIEIRTVLDPKLGSVKADLSQLEQVLMNLAVNARDAMPTGGKLTIETNNIYLDEAYVQQHVVGQPGSYVLLAVSDTGMGMDAATQAHAFEPFFTTKERGKGTGLGLSTVYGIIKQSGGYIWLYSEAGKGTTFKIYLPRVDGAAEEELIREKHAAVPAGGETVLLLEDEPALRELVREWLTGIGYVVLEAKGGAEALEISRSYSGSIDLLLTDVVMPGMSGRQLAERLTPSRPGMRVLYVSGYTTDAIVHHGVLQPGVAFLQKPFTRAALAQKLRETLDPPRPA